MVQNSKSRLILGTAQFGQPYGIKNDGVPSEQELERIARVAWDGGIRVIHTSWQYNLPKICEAIFSEFEWIKKDEKCPQLFYWNDEIGISAYELREIRNFKINCIVPINLLDYRFLNFVRKPSQREYKTIARSVFLQGLLLMDRMPEWVRPKVRQKFGEFRRVCEEHGIERYQAALGWVLGLDEIDYVIVGVNNSEQLKQLLEVKPLKWDYDFSVQDENVLDPRRWQNQEKERIEFLRKHNSINYG